MTTELVLFIILGIVAVGTGIAVITARNPIHAVLYLVINFFTLAMFYLVLSAQFIAFLQVLVYAGAIMVLFLFVMMLLNLTGAIENMRDKLPNQKWVAAAAAVVLLIEFATIATAGNPLCRTPISPLPADFGTSRPVAELLYSGYVLPFEVTSVLLLIAMIGSIVIARRRSA